MGIVVTSPWLFQMGHFQRFGSVVIPYIVHSTIGLLSDSCASYMPRNKLFKHTETMVITEITKKMTTIVIMQTMGVNSKYSI